MIERYIKAPPQRGERARATCHAHMVTTHGLAMWPPSETAHVQMIDHGHERPLIDLELARLALALELSNTEVI